MSCYQTHAGTLILWIAAAGLAISPAATAAGEGELATLDPRLFPVPEALRPNVEFWTKVYTEYDSHHVLLHDERFPDVVYAVLDFTELDEAETSELRRRKMRWQAVREAQSKYRAILGHLAAGKTSDEHPLDQERVARLFESVPGERPAKYSAAVHRMRTQTCLRDRFAEGIERSGLYLGAIEEIFLRRGLPVELTRLPFVESLFQIRAHSSAAAAGIWQFVRSTARLYLAMELEYDERFDPLGASDAAARHLADNYAALESWPLAVTAYNHGTNGMRRAVRLLGTRDLGEIVTRYRSRTFGFASRNFYSEFVAAAEIYANREHYFPGVAPLPAVEFDLFEPERYVPVRQLAEATSAAIDELREMNPALAHEVWSDDLYLPAKYPLRVPKGQSAEFRAAYASLDDSFKPSHQVGLHYRVRRGDTLGRIARQFGTSISALQRVNGLRSAHRIRVGQTLLIPPARGTGGARSPTTTTATAIAGPRPRSHVVVKGDTLWLIARRYGVTIEALRAANRLADADRIVVGQRLSIPAAGQQVHVVRRGDTLTRIAARYGTTVAAIKAANRLRGDLIQPAQVLIIP